MLLFSAAVRAASSSTPSLPQLLAVPFSNVLLRFLLLSWSLILSVLFSVLSTGKKDAADVVAVGVDSIIFVHSVVAVTIVDDFGFSSLPLSPTSVPIVFGSAEAAVAVVSTSSDDDNIRGDCNILSSAFSFSTMSTFMVQLYVLTW